VSVKDLLQTAISKRQGLISGENNALRIFDGLADGVSGVSIDQYADVWLVATTMDWIPELLLEELHQEGAEGQSIYWKKLSQTQKESPLHLCGPEVESPFIVMESGVNYEISMESGYSQGIFLDQRTNRKLVREHSGEGKRVLNTFAYTGAFSACAGLGGTITTTLDLSKPYLDWAKRNIELNGMLAEDHFFCKGDTFQWLARFAKQGRKFDGIILDPPTFSRDHKGKVFKVEKDYAKLVQAAAECLNEDGWLLACTNCRKLNHGQFMEMVASGLERAGFGDADIRFEDMPEEYTDEEYLKSVWVEV